MKLLANKEIRFNGSITLTDTYGKNPTRVIKFKDAKIETYSDQFSDMSYNDNYGAAVISITSSKLNIDGIEIEP